MIVKMLILFVCIQLVDSCRLRCRERQCDNGWTYYKRNTTGWCMKIVSVPEKYMTKSDGVAACADLGAVLTSIDDSTMEDVINTLIIAANIQKSSWIGGTLKTECTLTECGQKTAYDECKLTETCGYNRYIWTDNFTTSSSDEYIFDRIKNVNWIDTVGYYYPFSEMCTFTVGKIDACDATMSPNSAVCGKKSNS